ncbi:hypothetical protein [Fulvivirga sp.]|uniref:hypothetical protein n=1 Tax=Fulvivirga sp. TaxID=1931237 RepID=UPI0032EECCE7
MACNRQASKVYDPLVDALLWGATTFISMFRRAYEGIRNPFYLKSDMLRIM